MNQQPVLRPGAPPARRPVIQKAHSRKSSTGIVIGLVVLALVGGGAAFVLTRGGNSQVPGNPDGQRSRLENPPDKAAEQGGINSRGTPESWTNRIKRTADALYSGPSASASTKYEQWIASWPERADDGWQVYCEAVNAALAADKIQTKLDGATIERVGLWLSNLGVAADWVIIADDTLLDSNPEPMWKRMIRQAATDMGVRIVEALNGKNDKLLKVIRGN